MILRKRFSLIHTRRKICTFDSTESLLLAGKSLLKNFQETFLARKILRGKNTKSLGSNVLLTDTWVEYGEKISKVNVKILVNWKSKNDNQSINLKLNVSHSKFSQTNRFFYSNGRSQKKCLFSCFCQSFTIWKNKNVWKSVIVIFYAFEIDIFKKVVDSWSTSFALCWTYDLTVCK